MDDLVKERLNWLRHQIEYYGRYHDHKETMAWVATVFYLGAIVYLLFNLDHVLNGIAVPITLTIVVPLAFCLICLFLRMQFNRRWVATEKVRIYRDFLIAFIDNAPVVSQNPKSEWAKWIEDAIEVTIKKEEKGSCEGWIKFLFKEKGSCEGWIRFFFKDKTEDLYFLKSKLATYSAVVLVTVLAIVLVWVQYC